ncbi:MAG: 1-acyl-sn-glycerol-3-phosphate acyltransferase [Saprospiraceae bacterium]
MRPHLLPDIHDWPVYILAKNRAEFVDKVIQDMEVQVERVGAGELDQMLSKTIFQERQRVKSNPWKADPPNESLFFKKLQREYNENKESHDSFQKNKQTASRLIHRYVEEISGSFNIPTFQFARKTLTWFFHFLYYPINFSTFSGIKKKIERLEKCMIINGQIEVVRQLFKDHTIILVPTHSSNLDSILVGYMVDTFGGLPAFSYGAGLNLFDSEFFAFFMNRLGAYRVDRRKKNQIYLHTLSTYSRLLAERGVNTIFFPGGTRSRSGEVEGKLKLGLLNSMVLAQRNLLQRRDPRKIIIVPVVIGYESVLEARSLILQHLKTTGQEKFITKESDCLRFQNIYILYGVSSEKVIQRISHFGNAPGCLWQHRNVDAHGKYPDHNGKPVHLGDYFKREGEFVHDAQRESIYTKELAEAIAREYKKNNFILPAHFVAFSAFKMYKEIHNQQDDINIVQSPEEEFSLPLADYKVYCKKLLAKMMVLQNQGKAYMSDRMLQDFDQVIEEGIRRVGVFHNRKVLMISNMEIITEDLIALYFYYNKLRNLEDDLKDIAEEEYQSLM